MSSESILERQVMNKKKTDYGRIFQHENGIVYINVDDDTRIDLPEATSIVEDIRAFDNSGKAQLLVVQGADNDISFAAQTYLLKANAIKFFALVVQSRLQAEIAQFFLKLLKVFRSTYEMEIFHTLSEAENWLLNGKRP